jgi:hypothetical protein
MKKLALTVAIVLAMGLSSFAQDGGLLNRGVSFDKQESKGLREGDAPFTPGHGESGDQPSAPLGGGVAVLLGLGAAYLIGKKRNEK